jgi:hypothetical protein
MLLVQLNDVSSITQLREYCGHAMSPGYIGHLSAVLLAKLNYVCHMS